MNGWISNWTEGMTNVCLRRPERKSLDPRSQYRCSIDNTFPNCGLTRLLCHAFSSLEIRLQPNNLRCECTRGWVGTTAKVRTPAHTEWWQWAWTSSSTVIHIHQWPWLGFTTVRAIPAAFVQANKSCKTPFYSRYAQTGSVSEQCIKVRPMKSGIGYGSCSSRQICIRGETKPGKGPHLRIPGTSRTTR